MFLLEISFSGLSFNEVSNEVSVSDVLEIALSFESRASLAA